LGCLGVREVIDNFAIWECLFDVVVVKVDYCISIRESLSSHPVAEDDLLLAIDVGPLHLAVLPDHLVLHCDVVVVSCAVISVMHLHLEVVFVVFTIVIFDYLRLHVL